MFGQLLSQIHGAMLTAGASEGDHQILEAPLLIVSDRGVDERCGIGEKLADALLVMEKLDDGCILARGRMEARFASGIGEAAGVEDKSAAMSGWVIGNAAMKRKTQDSHRQLVGVGSHVLKFLRSPGCC